MIENFQRMSKNSKSYIIYAFGRILRGSIAMDRLYLKLLYKHKLGKSLNLNKPETYNEKIQWLKLYDRNPIYTKFVDKYEVRKYVGEKIGAKYLIPLLGVWDAFDRIDFSEFPEQFVLKCTHDSGGIIICTDKSKFDSEMARKKISHCMRRNYFWNGREWPYFNVKPRILAEPYMVDESGWELKDYKVFCFHGEPKLIEVDYNRYIVHKLNVYDLDWNYMDVYFTSHNDPNTLIEKPKQLDKMLQLSRILSKDIPFLRVDFYSIGDLIYCGELTLSPGSGFIDFYPSDMDLKMGSWLKLNNL